MKRTLFVILAVALLLCLVVAPSQAKDTKTFLEDWCEGVVGTWEPNGSLRYPDKATCSVSGVRTVDNVRLEIKHNEVLDMRYPGARLTVGATSNLENKGMVVVYAGLTNHGGIVNKGAIDTHILLNYGTLVNKGAINTNRGGGSLINYAGATIENKGCIVGAGFINYGVFSGNEVYDKQANPELRGICGIQ